MDVPSEGLFDWRSHPRSRLLTTPLKEFCNEVSIEDVLY